MGICLAEVEHKISQCNGVGINYRSVNYFIKHVLTVFTYCRRRYSKQNVVVTFLGVYTFTLLQHYFTTFLQRYQEPYSIYIYYNVRDDTVNNVTLLRCDNVVTLS